MTDVAPAAHDHAPPRALNVGGLIAVGIVALLLGLGLAAVFFG